MADYTLSAKITGDSAGFSKAFASASNVAKGFQANMSGLMDNIKSIGAKMSMVGAGMTAGLTMPFLGAVKSTAEFEDSMNKVRVTLLGGQKETSAFRQTFSGLQADALQLAAKFPVNAQEVADSMLELAKSGNNANAVMDMMPGILSAASAAGEDVATTSNTVSAAINGFGLKASDAARVADILTNSANASKAGIADMGEVFKYAAPTAKTLGISIEELSAASGLMMDKGLEASQVGTSLTMAFTRMVKPTKQAQEVMDKLGFSAVDSKGNFKSLSTIVGELNTDMKNYTPAQKTAALATIMGTEAGSKFLMLMDSGADKIKANTKAISERGTAEKTAAEMQKSLSANIETMQGSLDALVKSIMGQDTPAISALTQKVTGLVDGFNNMSNSTKGTIATIAAIAAAIGPVLLVLGPLTTGVGIVGSALVWLTTPVGLVVGVLAALAAAFAYEMQTNSKFAASVKQVTANVVTAFSTIKSAVGDLISGNNAGATNLLSSLIPASAAKTVVSVITSVESTIGNFKTNAVNAFTAVKSVAGSVADIFQPVLAKITPQSVAIVALVVGIVAKLSSPIAALSQMFVSGFGAIGPALSSAFGGFMSIAGKLIGVFAKVMAGGNPIVSMFKLLGGSVMSLFTPVGAVIGVITGLIATFAYLMATSDSFRQTVMSTVSSVVQALIPAFTSIGLAITNIVTTVVPVIMGLVQQLLPVFQAVIVTVMQLIAGIAPLVATLITALMPAITNIVTAIVNFVSAVAPTVIVVIQTIIQIVQALIPVIMGIATVVVNVVANIIAVVSTIISFVSMVISTIMEVITPIVAFVAGIISAIVGVISPIVAIVSGVFSTATSIMSGSFRTALSVASTVFNAIGSVINGIIGVVGRVFGSIQGTISRVMNGVSSTITGVFSRIQGAWTGLTGFVSGIFSGIGGAVQTLVGQVKGFVNGVIGGINGAIGLINKIPGVSIGRIPQLARGTSNFDGGFARMNEGGRGELTFLPNGTQVIPHDVSMRAAREQGRATAQMTSGTPVVMIGNQPDGTGQIVAAIDRLYDKDAHVYVNGQLIGEYTDKYQGQKVAYNERWDR